MKTKNLILLESFMKLKIQEAQSNLEKGETLDTDVLANGIFESLKNTLNESTSISKGSNVSWKYGTGTATGKVESVHKGSVTRSYKGSEIHRNGSEENPALVILQPNGSRVLKLKSEVKSADKLKQGKKLDNADKLEEGIFDGIKNIFTKDSTISKGATNTIQAARDAANQRIDKVKQVASNVKSDYQVGTGAAEMKKIASNLAKLDAKFGEQKADLSQRWSAINKERAKFQQTYKAAKKQLQDKLAPVYQTLAKAMKIDATQADYMDKIDAVLKQKNLGV